MILEKIVFNINQMKREEVAGRSEGIYSHPAFAKKIDKGIIPCDFDKVEKKIEFETDQGDRAWIDLQDVFGKVIPNVKNIFLDHNNGFKEPLDILTVKTEKIKRTTYIKLIFETQLPF